MELLQAFKRKATESGKNGWLSSNGFDLNKLLFEMERLSVELFLLMKLKGRIDHTTQIKALYH